MQRKIASESNENERRTWPRGTPTDPPRNVNLSSRQTPELTRIFTAGQILESYLQAGIVLLAVTLDGVGAVKGARGGI